MSIKEVLRVRVKNILHSRVRSSRTYGYNRFFISVSTLNEKVWMYVQPGTDFLHWTSDFFEIVYSHNETIKFT